MSLRVTILGCGSSGGVPRVGSGWGACDPAEPRNRRRRCSIFVEQTGLGERTGEAGTTTILVDTSPDLREQLLDAGVKRLDAVLYTHEHADHTHGIDDLRGLVLTARRRVPVHLDEATATMMRARFLYCFETPPGGDYPPIVDEHRLHAGTPVRVDGPGGPLEALPFALEHGSLDVLGFRFGDIAYTPDVSAIPDTALPALAGLDLWIVDALRIAPHPTHFNVEEALSWIERMRPRRAVLTNLHTDLDYGTLRRSLPPGVEPAYDGMELGA